MWLIYLLGGKQVRSSLTSRIIPSGFELGGKDPAYVRADANLLYSAENILDGVFYNSGQSCCSIERIYVAREVYDEFVEKCVKIAKSYKLGDALSSGTTLAR
jgi:acyl-CoA reductase-like NAD-dependent aldehyde dehydrogenase